MPEFESSASELHASYASFAARIKAGIKARFHDLRHTAVTTMAEAGLPDLTIMAQVGHVSPEMMKTYSHIRREALNQAATALQPQFAVTQPAVEMVN